MHAFLLGTQTKSFHQNTPSEEAACRYVDLTEQERVQEDCIGVQKGTLYMQIPEEAMKYLRCDIQMNVHRADSVEKALNLVLAALNAARVELNVALRSSNLWSQRLIPGVQGADKTTVIPRLTSRQIKAKIN